MFDFAELAGTGEGTAETEVELKPLAISANKSNFELGLPLTGVRLKPLKI